MDELVVARALHVLAVVIWIGGVSMATTVVLPAARRGDLGPDLLQAFQAIERRFVWQARAAVVVVGLSGFYMIWQLDLWYRFQLASYWWMHAMFGVWLLFTIILFIGEPLVLRRHLHHWAAGRPRLALDWLIRVHWVLLILSVITVLGAVTGSHG